MEMTSLVELLSSKLSMVSKTDEQEEVELGSEPISDHNVENPEGLRYLNHFRDFKVTSGEFCALAQIFTLVGRVSRPSIIDVNWYRICVDLYEVA